MYVIGATNFKFVYIGVPLKYLESWVNLAGCIKTSENIVLLFALKS
jgi:hypothetical protein